MAAGPGKYDYLCTQAREAAEASAAVLIIVGGNRGPGFAVQVAGSDPREAAELTHTLANVLRQAADQMQADARRLRQKFAAGEKLDAYKSDPSKPTES